MKKYVEVGALRDAMYHEVFETDTKMQRWDSGCWIRYKLFENILEQQTIVNVDEVKHANWLPIKRGDKGYSAGDFICSCCGKPNKCYSITDYCCNCGAKMRGTEE